MRLIDDVLTVLNNLGIKDDRIGPALKDLWRGERHIIWTEWTVEQVIKSIEVSYGCTPSKDEALKVLNATVNRYGCDTTEDRFNDTYEELIGLSPINTLRYNQENNNETGID